MALTVHVVEADDWQLWRELRLRALADSPDSFRPTFEDEELQSDGWWIDIVGSTVDHVRGGLWIALLGHEPVGISFGRIHEDFTILEVGAMWVAAEKRRTGAGATLLQAAIDWARELAVPTAELWVTETNQPAVAFYRSHGFEPTGETDTLRNTSDLTIRKMRRSI